MSEEVLNTYDGMLEDHGLRRTAFRREVIAIFHQHEGKAISSAEIEDRLGTFDRITLYRTLKSFEEKGLIHLASEPTGQVKYALCGGQCTSEHHYDGHAHFHCNNCGQTVCLDEVSKNVISGIPNGYEVRDIQINLSGICQKCK